MARIDWRAPPPPRAPAASWVDLASPSAWLARTPGEGTKGAVWQAIAVPCCAGRGAHARATAAGSVLNGKASYHLERLGFGRPWVFWGGGRRFPRRIFYYYLLFLIVSA
jgi:hypothetical protein